MGIKDFIVDLEKENYLTSAGAITSKSCTVVNELNIDEVRKKLIQGDIILGKNNDSIFTTESAEVTISRKKIVAVGFKTVDSHYYLEKEKLIKIRDKKKYRVTVDVSGISDIVLSRLIVEKQYPEFRGLEDSELLRNISPILTFKERKVMNLAEIFDYDMHLEKYRYNLLNEIKQGVLRVPLADEFAFRFLEDFSTIYYRIKLNILMQLNRNMRAVSLGANDLLFDTDLEDYNIIVKYRDIEKNLPFTIEEY